MALTDEQLLLRESAIGSSDLPAIIGVNPWKTPCDVWCTKRTPSRDPLVRSQKSEQTEVGEELEEAVCRMYARRMGVKLRKSGTVVHKEHPWMVATPDRLIVGQRVGVEAKVVGLDMAQYWRDGIPDWVRAQVLWQLMVLDYEAWDVAALIGTERVIVRVHRDSELEESLFERAREFWEEYVLGDKPPPHVDEDDRGRYLRARYPKPKDEMVESTQDIDAAVARSMVAAEILEKAKAEKQRADNDVLELIGDRRGVKGPWGSASAPSIAGVVAWKDVALELCNGVLPDEVVERHRGEPYRKLGIYKKKVKA